ncbi:uncharacterized protein FIBRA_07608 [Fibroporia radiculosa]|uniref:Uncharacterized protein n=1 Tax=Fibroporia radiculosa TaxID=599839 RepID=J4I101_9APHY|nr:uncharacterized protein FIBRA_07608 [Fibroporia radiculosa]CCM05392.1 predicted protein [Fibroporia radiculosa]
MSIASTSTSSDPWDQPFPPAAQHSAPPHAIPDDWDDDDDDDDEEEEDQQRLWESA